VFEAKRSDRVKLVWWDGTGLCLMAKKLESGGFKWPGIQDGVMRLTAAQLGALLEGLDWRRVHADVARLSRKSPVDGAFSGLFTQLMLMERTCPTTLKRFVHSPSSSPAGLPM
jgi:hypothetical protein